MSIFEDIQPIGFEKFNAPQFSFPDLILKSTDRKSVITWGDVAKITERVILDRMGFTVEGLKTISSLWQLKEQSTKIINRIWKGLPVKVYKEFDQLVDAFLLTVVKKSRTHGAKRAFRAVRWSKMDA